ncbi:hypothetical protein ZWY2020_024702 [Hordeum vulgare]|nr:hypothetical protein ZWY2020_024702 [Hordeum vulgare]
MRRRMHATVVGAKRKAPDAEAMASGARRTRCFELLFFDLTFGTLHNPVSNIDHYRKQNNRRLLLLAANFVYVISADSLVEQGMEKDVEIKRANDVCKDGKRQMINAEDVFKALDEIEFPEFLEPLRTALEGR